MIGHIEPRRLAYDGQSLLPWAGSIKRPSVSGGKRAERQTADSAFAA